MIIVYNPKNGAPIKGFVIEGTLLDEHPVGELRQYPEGMAAILLEHYGFLEKLTPDQAQKLVVLPKVGALKCSYCDFTTDHQIALSGHLRTHKDEIAKVGQPTFDPGIIPVAGGKKVGRDVIDSPQVSQEVDLPNGMDAHGVSWYGEGLTEESPASSAPVTPIGQGGHFGAA